jgi:hypothetical protein
MTLSPKQAAEQPDGSLRTKIKGLSTSVETNRDIGHFRSEYENLVEKRGFEDFQLTILGLFTVSNVYVDLYRQNVFGEEHIFDVLSAISMVVLTLCYYLLAVEILIDTYVAIKDFVEKKKPIPEGESRLRRFLFDLAKMAIDALLLIASIPALRIFRSLRTLFVFTHLERITRQNSINSFVGDHNSGRPIVSIVEQSDYTRVGSMRFLFLLAYSCSLVLISVSDSIFQAEGVPLFHGVWPIATNPLKPDAVASFSDALWYSVNDLTTVGCQYNVYTLSGRVLAVLLIVLGFTLLALLTNFFMRFLLSVFSDQVKILSVTHELADEEDLPTGIPKTKETPLSAEVGTTPGVPHHGE